MSQALRIVRLTPDQFVDPPPPFRTGSAGFLRMTADGDFETETRLEISGNSTHALIGHGVVDALNDLGLEGTIGGGIPAVIRPTLVEAARSILYEADRKTYGGSWEFVVHREEGDSPVEYRVAVANREYQVSLVRLVDVLNQASRIGEAVWIEI